MRGKYIKVQDRHDESNLLLVQPMHNNFALKH